MRVKYSGPVLLILLLLGLVFVPAADGAVGITPLQGVVGTEVFVSDLTYNTSYVIKWDAISVKSGVVPTSETVSFFVADSVSGVHAIVVESPSGTTVFSGNFTVLPSISIDTSDGVVGDTITVKGTGFAASESSVKILLDAVTVKSGFTVNSVGTWETTFILPPTTNGSHVIDASGSSTDADDVTDRAITVTPDLVVDPNGGGVGITMTVSGSAFDSAEPGISVTYDGTQVRSGIVADTKGSWKTTFAVPVSTKGDHVIDASGSNTSASEVPDATFSVKPGVTVLPNSVYVGEQVVINGSGYATSEANIKVLLGATTIASGITANDDGQWSASYTVPETVNGSHIINASGDVTPAADVTTATLKVMAKLVLKPTSGSVGDSISLSGTGFSKNSAINIKYGDKDVALGISSNTVGSFNAAIPAQENISGNIVIAATDSEGVTASSTFSMEAMAPEKPRIAAPRDGARVGYIGDTKAKFDWTDVSDPSGVFYNFQLGTTADFSSPDIDVSKLTESEYTLLEAESLPPGQYYWRVQAVDRAGNKSDWVGPYVVKTAYVSMQTFIIIVVAVIAFLIIISTVPRAIVRALKRKSDKD